MYMSLFCSSASIDSQCNETYRSHRRLDNHETDTIEIPHPRAT